MKERDRLEALHTKEMELLEKLNRGTIGFGDFVQQSEEVEEEINQVLRERLG